VSNPYVEQLTCFAASINNEAEINANGASGLRSVQDLSMAIRGTK